MGDFLEALGHADAGRPQAGFDCVARHLEGGLAPQRALELAPLLVLLHRTRQALELLVRVDSPVASRLAGELALRAGLDEEGIRLLERHPPLDEERAARITEARLRARDYESLLGQSLLGPSPLAQRAKLQALIGVGRRDEALAACPDEGARIELGDFARDPVDLDRRQGLVDTLKDDARHEVARAYANDDWTALELALASWPEDAESLVWRGELHAKRGEREAAFNALDAAMHRAGSVHLPALLVRLKLEMEGDLEQVRAGNMRREQTTDGPLNLASEIRAALGVMWGKDRFEGVDLAGVIELLRESIEKLGLHRSPNVSYIDDAGRAVWLPVSSPREDSRRQLERIRVAAAETVFGGLAQAAERWPNSESPRVHEGELRLWLGQYRAAQACFEEALEGAPGTRWAYIGLGGALMLQGKLDEALEVQDEGVRVLGSEVGSVFIYRGEARRRIGPARREDALSDLRKSHAHHPSRLSAWLNLALMGWDREKHVQALVDFAPLLLEDTVGPDAFTEAFASRATDAQLEAALDALQGNRSSSCITYRIGEHPLRALPRPRLDQPDAFRTKRKALSRGLRRRWTGLGVQVP